MNSAAKRGLALFAAGLLLSGACSSRNENVISDTQTFRVRVVTVNGKPPPKADQPLPPSAGGIQQDWEVEIEAIAPDGGAADFDGFVRLSAEPGAVAKVVDSETGESIGRNLQLVGGKASAVVSLTAVYGPARLWVEDLGYAKAPAGKTPACANGKNDDPDEDVLVDFPNDPGCAFADDDTEEGGTFSAGVSPPVAYELLSIQDVQGKASVTPYPFESVSVNTSGDHFLVVTRIAKDGFYVTDLSGQDVGFNHMFAFSFSTPQGLRVCDRITQLSGTVSEFFGFTEMNFPSFDVDRLFEGEAACPVPDPPVLTPKVIGDALQMERLESGLVQIDGYHVSSKLGSALALNNVFAAEQTNCDFNGDGKIDFQSATEGACGNACSDDPECTEWTSFISRGNYKVSTTAEDEMGNLISSVMQVQTDGAPEFNPVANRGRLFKSVVGTLRNFSGGNQNWTIEARCPDDVVCDVAGCAKKLISVKQACVKLRTDSDNDEGTN